MKIRLLALISFLLLLSAYSCRREQQVDTKSPALQSQVGTLVSKGIAVQTTNADSLEIYTRQLEKIVRETHNPTAFVYASMFRAQNYWHAGNHKDAMITAVRGLEEAEKNHINKPISGFYGMIANLHKENANYKLAFDAQEKGYRFAKQYKDTAGMIRLISNRAMFIHSARLRYNTPPNQDSSIVVHLRGLKLAESKAEFSLLRIPFYNNIAQYYKDLKDYKKAIEYAGKAVALATEKNQQRSLTYSYVWLGQSWYALGDHAKGFNYLNQALNIAKKLKHAYREMEICSDLYQMHYQSGNFKEALDFNIRQVEIRDSLQVQLNEKQISELQIKYETARKDKQLLISDSERKRQNEILLSVFAGAIILLLLLVLLTYRYRLIRNNNRVINKSNADKTTALEHIAVIQAHDLRKPLASILGLIHVIKAMGEEVDPECINNLETAAHELDAAVHTVISTVEKAETHS
ncbi:MAG: tetratricopeptide repeat protein [Pedobacter sp.]|nr:MAG: tetratricopeptide repeat protein [Pedobacter sp.]